MTRAQKLTKTLTVILIFFAVRGFAQSTLTQIQDTVTNSNGQPFNGTVVITWVATSSSIAGPTPYSTSAKIYNGALSVAVVPSESSTTNFGYYQAVYNSSDGLTSWSETWEVPASTSPLTLSQVRQSVIGVGVPVLGTISINEIIGLNSYLTAFNTSLSSMSSALAGAETNIGTLNTEYANLNTVLANLPQQPATSAVFVDAETPAGTINGTNKTFSLANTPLTTASVVLYKNGVMQTQGSDFALSGSIITFASNAVPQLTDTLRAYYRMAGQGQTANFVDSETPSGIVNGSNMAFTLAIVPSPALSLKLYKNGVLLLQGSDYNVSGSAITFSSQGVTPQTGDAILAYYRH